MCKSVAELDILSQIIKLIKYNITVNIETKLGMHRKNYHFFTYTRLRFDNLYLLSNHSKLYIIYQSKI